MKFLLVLAVAQFSTQFTHYLIVKRKMGSIRASTLVTLLFIAATTPFSFGMSATLQAVCLGSSFVGMTDPKRLGIWPLALASLAFAVVFTMFIHYLNGLGGALGSSAFVSCLLIYYIAKSRKIFIKEKVSRS